MRRRWGRALAAVLLGAALVPAASRAAPVPVSPAPVDSALQAVADAQTAGLSVTRAAEIRDLQASGGRVLVTVQTTGDPARARRALEQLGLDVTATSRLEPFDVVDGWLAPEQVRPVAALPMVRTVDPALGPEPDTGTVVTQGDAAHGADAARARWGVTGSGQVVGILSDSFDWQTPTTTFSSPELPNGVTVLSDGDADPDVTDEGRAMAEIVADEAPGATLVFAAVGSSATAKVNAIASLRAAGATVIADDVPFLGEPTFQDGRVAQAVDAARAAGVVYLASAGNRGRQSWEGRFLPATPATTVSDADFGGGDVIQSLGTVPPGGRMSVELQWDEPWGGASTNLDAALVAIDAAGGVSTLTTATTVNAPGGNPRERVTWLNPSTSASDPRVSVGLRVTRVSPAGATPFMKTLVYGEGGTSVSIAHATGSDTINPDSASAVGGLAVAAVRHSAPGLSVPEAASSRGPKTRLFSSSGVRLAQPEVRAKPDLAAADCVATSVVTSRKSFTTFCGTSAAVASAAGVAALVRAARPTLDVAQATAVLTDPGGAIDCTSTAGQPDVDCGVGFVRADWILGTLLDTTPPAITATTVPAAPNGRAGWFVTPPGVTFAVADPDSRVSARAGCDPATVSAQGTTTVTCAATSGGGTASAPITVRLDSVPPVITGVPVLVGGRTYPANELPLVATCTATDGASGVQSCRSGVLDDRRGEHTADVVATDRAGLTSTRTITYRVGPPIDRAGPRLAAALRRGAPTVAALLGGRGFRLSATGLPAGRLSVTVRRGAATLASAAATARAGRATATLRATSALRRRLIRRAQGARVVVVVRYVAEDRTRTRSARSRTVRALR